MKLRKVLTKRIQSLKEKDPPIEECSKSVQSFRDIIPQDNRLDLNSATEKQLHTLPGLNKVSIFRAYTKTVLAKPPIAKTPVCKNPCF